MAASGFGQRVFQARLALSAARGKTVTQADVAREMGVVGVTVGRWEAGLKEPDLKTIERLAVVLETDPAWLAFGLVVAPLKEVPPGTPGAIPVVREPERDPRGSVPLDRDSDYTPSPTPSEQRPPVRKTGSHGRKRR